MKIKSIFFMLALLFSCQIKPLNKIESFVMSLIASRSFIFCCAVLLQDSFDLKKQVLVEVNKLLKPEEVLKKSELEDEKK